MKILVLGSGAREHAITHAFAKEKAHELHALPGNPGIGQVAQLHPGDAADGQVALKLANELQPDLIVIGPEAPLVAGVADVLGAAGFTVFGPTAQAAQLEGSKAFAKEVMNAAAVPTATARVCQNLTEIEAALKEFGAPHVVKDDGLAAGKGVVVTEDFAEALAHGQACFDNGARQVVIEEYLDGPEVSLFCISDGKTVVPLAPAQDFKRAYDADAGPNTGGMGAYSPLPWAPSELVGQVVETVAQPTIAEMAKRGTPFAGVLYVGLALTSRGVRVVEFNARFGDPETQVVLARLQTPLSELLSAAAKGELAVLPALQWTQEAAVTVVLAANGYPQNVVSGDVISGLENVADQGAYVLHAGTKTTAEGLVSSGGRVLSVVGLGADLSAARKKAYAGIGVIELKESHYRKDIAARAAGE